MNIDNHLDNCQNDLPVLEMTSRSGIITKLALISNPSKTNELHFEQDNLLPGKYSGISKRIFHFNILLFDLIFVFSYSDQVETE